MDKIRDAVSKGRASFGTWVTLRDPVAAEIMGASRGLGYLLIDGESTGRPAILIASIIFFGICGKLTDSLLVAGSARWLAWQDVYRG